MSSSLWVQPPRQAHISQNQILLSAVAQCPAGILSPRTQELPHVCFQLHSSSVRGRAQPGPCRSPRTHPRVPEPQGGSVPGLGQPGQMFLFYTHTGSGRIWDGFFHFSPQCRHPGAGGAVPAVLPQLCCALRSSGAPRNPFLSQG